MRQFWPNALGTIPGMGAKSSTPIVAAGVGFLTSIVTLRVLPKDPGVYPLMTWGPKLGEIYS